MMHSIAGALVLAVVLVGCSTNEDDSVVDEVRNELSTATFRCGGERCALNYEYCLVKWSNGEVSGPPAKYSCEAIPVHCTEHTACACIGSAQCFEEDGRVIVDAH